MHIMSRFIGVVVHDYEYPSFSWTAEFNADSETEAYSILHDRIDASFDAEEQKKILNDLVINLDEPGSARIRPYKQDLASTYKNMVSDDPEERLKAEYDQLTIRIDKLTDFINDKARNVDVAEDKLELMVKQLDLMKKYKEILFIRLENF